MRTCLAPIPKRERLNSYFKKWRRKRRTCKHDGAGAALFTRIRTTTIGQYDNRAHHGAEERSINGAVVSHCGE